MYHLVVNNVQIYTFWLSYKVPSRETFLNGMTAILEPTAKTLLRKWLSAFKCSQNKSGLKKKKHNDTHTWYYSKAFSLRQK